MFKFFFFFFCRMVEFLMTRSGSPQVFLLLPKSVGPLLKNISLNFNRDFNLIFNVFFKEAYVVTRSSVTLPLPISLAAIFFFLLIEKLARCIGRSVALKITRFYRNCYHLVFWLSIESRLITIDVGEMILVALT